MSTITAVMNAVTTQVSKIVEVMTPIAKQAYETGLLVIRIDGLATLVPALIVFTISVLMLRNCYNTYKKYRGLAISYNVENPNRYPKDFTDFAPGQGIPTILVFILSVAGFTATSIVMLNVWLWIKVFVPQLWLAHEAILKILEKAT